MARHAQAQKAEVCLRFAPDVVSLTIHDDGKGFDVPESPAEMAPAGHVGLPGFQKRAEAIGARLEIDSAAGVGTKLVVCLPQK